MKDSQYVNDYLNQNQPPLTISSYLGQKLRGRAREYAGQYRCALQRSINRRIADGSVEACKSRGNRLAYRRIGE